MSSGKIHSFYLQSKLLRSNPLKNSTKRQVVVYTPPEFSKKEQLPIIYFLPGFGSGPEKWLNKDFPGYRLLELLILNKTIPRVILCCIDGMTRFGGSQYIDSALNGPFAQHIIKEIVPTVQKKFNTLNQNIICGHSSGGFGALHLASRYPDVFKRCASFAGDLYFELTHKNMLSDFYNKYQKGVFGTSLNECLKLKAEDYILGLSAAYTPKLSLKTWKMEFPINVSTGEINTTVWNKWLQLDPVETVPQDKAGLKKLESIYLSAGTSDQFALHIGANVFHERCKKHKIKTTCEFHDGNHSLLIRQFEAGIKHLLLA